MTAETRVEVFVVIEMLKTESNTAAATRKMAEMKAIDAGQTRAEQSHQATMISATDRSGAWFLRKNQVSVTTWSGDGGLIFHVENGRISLTAKDM